jgi:hypothetical protein
VVLLHQGERGIEHGPVTGRFLLDRVDARGSSGLVSVKSTESATDAVEKADGEEEALEALLIITGMNAASVVWSIVEVVAWSTQVAQEHIMRADAKYLHTRRVGDCCS